MTALITGATKGIGRAIAIKFAQQGFNLVLLARKLDDLEALALELQKYPVKVFIYAIDLSKSTEIKEFFEQSTHHFDQVDILVNNAGVFLPNLLLEEDDESFHNQMALNVNAPYMLSKYFGKKMREQQSGHIFNIGSIASKQAVQNAGSYSVTKAAMLSLNDVLRAELSLHQVKVTAVLPGSTLTASWEGTTIPAAKFVQPEDIAEMIYATSQLSNGANVDEITITPLRFN